MIDTIGPYLYVIGAGLDVLLIGTATLAAFSTTIDSKWATLMALLAALCTWGATAFLVLNPPGSALLRTGEMATWIPLSAICVALLWFCRLPASEPPEPPPPSFPKINGEFRPTTQRRTYRLRTRRNK